MAGQPNRNQLREWALFAERTARSAGERILDARSRQTVEIRAKRFGEVVTSADYASDRLIRDEITRTYPSHEILSEETADHPWEGKGHSGPLWVIDPLDGTVNFAYGMPHFAISVAVAVEGQVQAGAVHAPDLDLTYVGIRGQGAVCNGTPIRVGVRTRLEESVVGTGFPHNREGTEDALRRVEMLALHCRDIRRLAAPTLDICFVAQGRLDAHVESLAEWDIAASGLIAREAGARMEHLRDVPEGMPPELCGREIMFAAPGIALALLALLRG